MSVGMKDKKEALTLTEISGIWGFARGAESRAVRRTERFAELESPGGYGPYEPQTRQATLSGAVRRTGIARRVTCTSCN